MGGVTANYGFAATPDSDRGIVRGRVIAEPGACEVRDVTGLQHQVLARDRFVVVAPR